MKLALIPLIHGISLLFLQPEAGSHKKIDAKIIAAFEESGAEFGGLSRNPGYSYFTKFTKGKEGWGDGLPGFRFGRDPKTDLPDPGIPFGVVYAPAKGVDFTDKGFRCLATLKSLTMLRIADRFNSDRPVSDAALKHLAGLSNLMELDLGFLRNITDVGVKELGGLKKLRILCLSGTAISDLGLRELSGLDNLVGTLPLENRSN